MLHHFSHDKRCSNIFDNRLVINWYILSCGNWSLSEVVVTLLERRILPRTDIDLSSLGIKAGTHVCKINCLRSSTLVPKNTSNWLRMHIIPKCWEVPCISSCGQRGIAVGVSNCRTFCWWEVAGMPGLNNYRKVHIGSCLWNTWRLSRPLLQDLDKYSAAKPKREYIHKKHYQNMAFWVYWTTSTQSIKKMLNINHYSMEKVMSKRNNYLH